MTESDPGQGGDGVHRSKIDAWLMVVLVMGFIIGVGGTIVGVVEGELPILLAAIILPIFAAVFLRLPFTIRYEIDMGDLKIRCGPCRWSIPVDSIREIRPSRNPLSAPAASMDRLRIDYVIRGGHRYVLVSPKDKQAFFEDLATAEPDLRIEGDGMKRE